ncbi:hypothetical protein [Olivibacter jilunii]|uniref:hypothetical protein n=1 Tax=Olivibacter jilunii TaxID=985016 RepID=UPI003F165588
MKMTTKTLFLTNRDDVSIEYLLSKFRDKSASYLRINSEDIDLIDFEVQPNGVTRCYVENTEYDLSSVKSVLFKRVPTKFNIPIDDEDRAYLVNERKHFFEGLYLTLEKAKWINPMFATHIAERKLFQLKVASKIGLKIPKSILTNKLSLALNFLDNNPLSIIKPISNGLQIVKDKAYSIYTTAITKDIFKELQLEETFGTPVFLQERISNNYDIRVTIVGEKIFAVRIGKEGDGVDWRKPEVKKEYKLIDLPITLHQKLLKLNEYFGMIYSAIDLILTPEGEYIFLEINPVGEWVWLEKELDIDISDTLIKELL